MSSTDIENEISKLETIDELQIQIDRVPINVLTIDNHLKTDKKWKDKIKINLLNNIL